MRAVVCTRGRVNLELARLELDLQQLREVGAANPPVAASLNPLAPTPQSDPGAARLPARRCNVAPRVASRLRA